jgi:carbonic anhydrase/acetyltransferase-like protein (isoleucine patch superfamily)
MALIKTVNGISPIFGKDCYLAENATIVGEVSMGEQCSVWFHTVIRGDVNSITIGNQTNIQDGAVIHCTYKTAKTVIGNKVSIGHHALVHGCTLEDETLIGMGAIVMDGAIVQQGAMVAAGAVVLEGTIVEAGFLYAGIPAKKIKPLDDKLKEMLTRISGNYIMYAGWFKE